MPDNFFSRLRGSQKNESRRPRNQSRQSSLDSEGLNQRHHTREDSRGSYRDASDRADGASRSGRTSAARDTASRRPHSTSSSMDGRLFNSRLGWMLLLFLFVALILVGRLTWLHIIDAQNIQDRGTSREVTVEMAARRGTIYDRNGTILATTIDAYNVYVQPHVIDSDKVDELAEALADTFNGDVDTYKEKITSDENFVYLYRLAEEDQIAGIKALNIEGVGFEETSKRTYPCGAVASQVIGLLNSDGDAISGLELYYDDILSGTDGEKITEYSKEGVPVPGSTKVTAEVVNGQDIVLSIDIEMQEYLEEALAVRVEEVDGEGGSAILMDAETGEIYACASSPMFDITDRSDVKEGATNISGIMAAFEPGSIMKPITMLAALEEGTVTLDSSYYCPARLKIGDDTITDSHERSDETMSVSTIIGNSSNVGISLVAKDLTFEKFYEYLNKYELTEKTGVDYPAEASGSLADVNNWSVVQGYNISFGQGLMTTPIEMVRFYAMLANDSVACTPHFLLDVPLEEEDRTYETTTLTDNTDAIDQLETMMETVVTSGTGTDAQIDGYRVVGKTGTAEIASESGGYKSGVYNISFIGYLPDTSTNLVCFVGATEVPGERKTVSAFQDIMSFAIDRYNITQD